MGRNAEEADAEEIINIANKASVADQQKQVQENIHSQIKGFCTSMDEILLPDIENIDEALKLPPPSDAASRRSGLSFAVGRNDKPTNHPGKILFAIQKTFSNYELMVALLYLQIFQIAWSDLFICSINYLNFFY